MDFKTNDEIARYYGLLDNKGKPYNIPADGSMALLALGYRGLMAWRAKRILASQKGKNDKP